MGFHSKRSTNFEKFRRLGDREWGWGVLNYINKIGRCAFLLTSPVRGAAAGGVVSYITSIKLDGVRFR